MSCEKADQTTASNSAVNGQLTNRTVAACEDCPNVTDCCCSVELVDPQASVVFRFCGTSDGTGTCTGSLTGCPSFSGGGQAITLGPGAGNFRKLFCMVPGNGFWVQNTDLGNSHSIILSCQYDVTNPQTFPITIPAGGTVYFTTTAGCVVDDCP